MKCVICKAKIMPDPDGWDGGHNAEPVKVGKCCGGCNEAVVVPMRLRQFQARKESI